jgi:thioredoxin-related protein
MKLFIPIFTLLLLGCTVNPVVAEDNSSDVDYPENFILWENLFDKEDERYFVYVFAYDCYYCNETKRKVVCFYNYSEYPVYFCEYVKQIPIGHNVDKTLGANEVKDVFIRGTPSLLFINNGQIGFNVAGKAEVNEMIDLQLKNEL